MICALLRVSSAPDWNRLNYLVGARRPGCWLGRARADHYSGLFKVWRLDLVGAVPPFWRYPGTAWV